jgi:anti-anti-sigma factor
VGDVSGSDASPPDGTPPGGSPPPCSLAVHRAGDAVVVAIRGELHADTVDQLAHILRDLICDQGNLNVAVDLEAVSEADAVGVAALVDARRLAREHHATLALVGLPPDVEQALGGWRHGSIVAEDGPAAPERASVFGEPESATAEPRLPAGLDDHVVEFYFREEHLARSVREFLLPALVRGQAALVVATDDHRRRCDEELRAVGVDLDDCRRHGRYLSLDAAETLDTFMVGGMPDRHRFETTVGELVGRMASGCGGIRIFGEMVAVLWADGNVAAAVVLEDLWNALRATETFELLCAYPTWLFERDDATEPFRRLCDQHTRVVPSESIAVEHGT